MGRFREEYLHYKEMCQHYCKLAPLPLTEALRVYWKNRQLPFKQYRLNDVSHAKTSDTIFLIGSGPSLNDLTPTEIDYINQHDSFGLSFSFVNPDIKTKYHFFFWHLNEVFPYYAKVLSAFRESMKEVIVFGIDYNLVTFIHPRVFPDMFPVNPKVCYFKRPMLIGQEDRPFSDEDFEKSFFYRNAMTMIIHLAVHMRYKKIVLLGVDPDKWVYFFEDYPIMKEIMDFDRRDRKAVNMDNKEKYYYMYPGEGRVHPFDVYLKSAADYLRRKKDITLYVSHKTNMLHPDIPAYFT